MAFNCTIKTYPGGLIGKKATLGLRAERFLARRSIKEFYNAKDAAEKAVKKHEITPAVRSACQCMQAQYYTFFNTMLIAKVAVEDFIHFVEVRGLGSRQILGYTSLLVKHIEDLAREGQKYGNALAELSRGKEAVAMSLSKKFYLNIDALQKFSARRAMGKALRYELSAEKRENAGKLSEREIINIIEDKIAEFQELKAEMKKMMTATRLFIEGLWKDIRGYDLPTGDVKAMLAEAADMFENELMCINQLSNNYVRLLEQSIKKASAAATIKMAA